MYQLTTSSRIMAYGAGNQATIPLFVRMAIPNATIYSFLSKMHGVGEMIVLIQMKFDSDVVVSPIGMIATPVSEDNAPIVMTFQMLLDKLVRIAVAAAPQTSTNDIRYVKVAFFSYIDVPENDFFSVKVTTMLRECELSLTVSQARPKPVKTTLLFGPSVDKA